MWAPGKTGKKPSQALSKRQNANLGFWKIPSKLQNFVFSLFHFSTTPPKFAEPCPCPKTCILGFFWGGGMWGGEVEVQRRGRSPAFSQTPSPTLRFLAFSVAGARVAKSICNLVFWPVSKPPSSLKWAFWPFARPRPSPQNANLGFCKGERRWGGEGGGCTKIQIFSQKPCPSPPPNWLFGLLVGLGKGGKIRKSNL